MNTYVWMVNLEGREVEVNASFQGELLHKGFRLIETPQSLVPKIQLDINLPNGEYPFGGYGRVVELLDKRFNFKGDSNTRLYVGHPREIDKNPGQKSILISAFEADVIPPSWIEKAKNFDLILVPSEWCKKLFIDSGITVPVETMIQGADNFDIVENNFHTPFRFLHYNAFSDYKRKGWDLVVNAFLKVFGRYEKVELVLKGRTHDNAADIKDIPKRPNIKILIQNMNRRELEQLQDETHVMVFPSKGEGLGLPPIETMARGIPTIVSNMYGMTEFAHFGIPLKNFNDIPAQYLGMDFEGKEPHWKEADQNELEEKMFYAYRNYEKVKHEAIQNSSILYKYFSLDAMTNRFKEVINQYGFN